MRKLNLSILFLLVVAGVPTAAHALDVKIYVTPTGGSKTLVYETPSPVPLTPSPTTTICPVGAVAPCTGAKGRLVSAPIASNIYGGVLQILAGAKGEAKIETNALTINASSTITNTLNVVGTFRMLVAGELEIVTSSDFNLRQGTTTTLSGGGTWQALGRGAQKCEKTSLTGAYQNSLCSISDASVDSTNYSNDCTLCRSYGFTDSGTVLRFDPATSSWTLPAGNVDVNMTSEVTFKNAAGTATKTEQIGAPITMMTTGSGLATDGKFVGTLSQNELVPCEPFLEPCANSERKSFTLRFANMLRNDQVNLPATSTDVGNTDLGGTLSQLTKIEFPIDVQPIDPVPSGTSGFYLPGTNNDWTQSQGNVHVLALSTPGVDGVNTCAIVPFDVETQAKLGFLSVAGSELVEFTSVEQFLVNGVCIGLRFQFDKSRINATIEPIGGTADQKQATCLASPVATLIIREAVTVQTSYSLVSKKGGGKKEAPDVPSEGCVVNGTTVTCNLPVAVSGSQIVKCATPAGGS
jgi:hypothetical protein